MNSILRNEAVVRVQTVLSEYSNSLKITILEVERMSINKDIVVGFISRIRWSIEGRHLASLLVPQ